MSLLFCEAGLLLFSVLSLRHSGRLPLFSASENRVLKGDGFKVVIGNVENEGGSSPKVIYSQERTGAYTTNLEIGVVVKEAEVGVSLGELGEGGSFLKLVSEFGRVVRMESVEVIGASNGGCMGCGRVAIIVV